MEKFREWEEEYFRGYRELLEKRILDVVEDEEGQLITYIVPLAGFRQDGMMLD